MSKTRNLDIFYLESIIFPDEMPAKDYARYCQLLVTAHQKNKVTISNDTLIQFVVNYYKNEAKDNKKYIQSLLLLGNVHEEQEKKKQ